MRLTGWRVLEKREILYEDDSSDKKPLLKECFDILMHVLAYNLLNNNKSQLGKIKYILKACAYFFTEIILDRNWHQNIVRQSTQNE